MTTDGHIVKLVCGACDRDATVQWQRRASDQEWQEKLAWADLRHKALKDRDGHPRDVFVPKDGVAYRPMFACDTHDPGTESRAMLHEATCRVGACACTLIDMPNEGPVFPEEGK